MDDKMLERIKNEAEDLEIPESLSPENMRKKLDRIDEEKTAGKKKIKRFPIRRAVMAASAALVLITGISYTSMKIYDDSEKAALRSGVTAEVTDGTDDSESYSIPGIMRTAKNYDDVADVIKTAKKEAERQAKLYEIQNIFSKKGDVVYEEAVEDAAMADGTMDMGATATTSAAPAAAEGSEAAKSTGTVDHSDTNVRTKNVDEGDIVKTDGKYIYQYFTSGMMRIVSIENGQMNVVSDTSIASSGDCYISEMYVKGDKLILIADIYETSLNNNSDMVDFYRINNEQRVHVMTYDITDRSHPNMSGEVTIDGYFRTSRLVDGYLYVMTSYGQPLLYYCGLDYGYYDMEGDVAAEDKADTTASGSADAAASEEEKLPEELNGVLPKINGRTVDACDILIPEKAKDEPFYTITSIDINDPGKTVDSKSVMGYVDQVYASIGSLFFYSADYTGEHERTEIVKFDYADGKITPQAAGSVPGYIDDSFSIDEDAKGNLRVATTDWSTNGNQESSLYILDRNMKTVGSLKDFAGNEGVKSCRFMGDIGYVVTFRNTDPLFTIDLSDPTNPVILSELTIPGFSEYLHYYGDGLLLGIGYDADTETGGTTGLKISMFDVSNPRETKEIAKTIIDADYSDLLYGNYKSILIDPEKNLFGFTTGDWGEEETNWEETVCYTLFTYQDKEFKNLLTKELDNDYGYIDTTRGVYAGNVFYLVADKKITSYDMTDYSKISEL